VQEWDLDASVPLPFTDSHFDAVIAKDILEHLQKPWLLVREMRRVLKPGGIVMASVISASSHRVWADYTHVRGFTRATSRQLFEDAGFSVDGVWRMGPVPGSARLNAIRFVPYLLACPPFNWIWFSSWEIRAIKPLSEPA
jgi:SAM-dependent methyltransferase